MFETRPTAKEFYDWHVSRRNSGPKYARHIAPALKLKDGSTISVQASSIHYCFPREDNPQDPYAKYEVWDFDKAEEPYGWMSVEDVIDMIMERGGIASAGK